MTGDLTKRVKPDGASESRRIQVSVIVPMLNEVAILPDLLAHLTHRQAQASATVEVLLVDGGSTDDSVLVAKAAGFRVLHSARGRAQQMNTGAIQANGEYLLFLHADTRLPDQGIEHVLQALARGGWGRFDVTITGSARMLRVIAWMINRRSRFNGIATGDQAMFVRRRWFERLGRFPNQPLMEDIELSKRLRHCQHPQCLRAKVRTSGRRWMEHGIWRTIFLMWRLRWAYWRGVPADQLAKWYR